MRGWPSIISYLFPGNDAYISTSWYQRVVSATTTLLYQGDDIIICVIEHIFNQSNSVKNNTTRKNNVLSFRFNVIMARVPLDCHFTNDSLALSNSKGTILEITVDTIYNS